MGLPVFDWWNIVRIAKLGLTAICSPMVIMVTVATAIGIGIASVSTYVISQYLPNIIPSSYPDIQTFINESTLTQLILWVTRFDILVDLLSKFFHALIFLLTLIPSVYVSILVTSKTVAVMRSYWDTYAKE